MASKQYISIIRLFHHCEIATADDFNISRARKQLQAEFNITQGGMLEVDGYTYTRHDVFEEIEQPDFLKRLEFHKIVWSKPQILRLLEKNTADLSTIAEEFLLLWGNRDFDQFFSPYFAGPFNYLSRTLLGKMQLKEMGSLLGYEDFLQPAEREEAFRPIRLFLDENIKTLRNINGENYRMMRPQIQHWITTEWFEFFNNMPPEFYDKKNDIAVRLVNLGVAIQKTHRKDCRKMSGQLVSLTDMPENLRTVIMSNHTIYSRSFGWGGRGFSWRGSGAIAWVIFILIRLATTGSCNDNTYNNSFTPGNVRYEIPDSILKYFKRDSTTKGRINIDSILKYHGDK